MALDREKAMERAAKVVDKLNEVGEKTSEKATQFVQEKGLDKKAEQAKEKTTEFIQDHKIDVAAVRKGCPVITNGDDEDMMSAAVATKILTDKTVYNRLIAE